MHSPSPVFDGSLRRHDFVYVSESAWQALMKTREDLASVPLVAGWIERGWPMVARRPGPGEMHGVALGLPLPPSLGKRRLAIVMQPEDIVATAPPLALRVAFDAAPPRWQSTLTQLVDLAGRHSVTARVFGSLAWQALTGLDYLSASSDLDLLMPLRHGSDSRALAAELDAIARAAPMRIDGEILRDDGAAVNWREIHDGAAEVLVKTLGEVRLLPAECFVVESALS